MSTAGIRTHDADLKTIPKPWTLLLRSGNFVNEAGTGKKQ